MANLLALEAATAACSVALSYEGQVIERHRIAPRQQSDVLLTFVDQVLAKAGIALSSIDAIVFGCGPGSFMGVRLTTGVAQGLAFGADLPLIPVSTLQALAQVGHHETGASHILPAWDARMGEMYWGAYAADAKGLMQAVMPDQLQAPGIWSVPEGARWLPVGNAWEVYEDALPRDGLTADIKGRFDLFPEAKAMLPWAESQFAKGQLMAADQVEPQYLREKVTS